MFNLEPNYPIVACHSTQRHVVHVFDYLVYTTVYLDKCLSIFSFHIKDPIQLRTVSYIDIFLIEFC